MNTKVVVMLEKLKQENADGSCGFHLACVKLDAIKREAEKLGFDREWLAMVFDRSNIKDWVRMALKLDHLCKLFRGRVVCVANFLKDGE